MQACGAGRGEDHYLENVNDKIYKLLNENAAEDTLARAIIDRGTYYSTADMRKSQLALRRAHQLTPAYTSISVKDFRTDKITA